MKSSVAIIAVAAATIGANVCQKPSCLAEQVAGGPITVEELRCEYARNPLGIEARSPRFSWLLESSRRGQMQSAYQVLVASTEQKLQAAAADKWDSGKVDSGRSVNVPYQGKPLASGERCWWKVRAWDKEGKASPWSRTATFEMALLKKSDWCGSWIAAQSVLPTFVEGKFGQAVPLDGKSEGVRVEHYNALKSKKITMAAWIK